jgi:hypothetical protein
LTSGEKFDPEQHWRSVTTTCHKQTSHHLNAQRTMKSVLSILVLLLLAAAVSSSTVKIKIHIDIENDSHNEIVVPVDTPQHDENSQVQVETDTSSAVVPVSTEAEAQLDEAVELPYNRSSYPEVSASESEESEGEAELDLFGGIFGGDSSSKAPAIPASLSYWMQQNLKEIGDLTLAQFTLPGSHDSGSYWLGKELGPIGTRNDVMNSILKLAGKLHIDYSKISNAFGQAQDIDIYHQAKAGARFFDLRCAWVSKRNRFELFHFMLGNPVESALQQLAQFKRENPNEIIMIHLNQIVGDESPTDSQQRILLQLIHKYFDGQLLPNSYQFDNLTLSQMISEKFTVVAVMESAALAKSDVHVFTGESIINSYANSDSFSSMWSYNNKAFDIFSAQIWPSNRLRKFSYTLTSQTSTIAKLLNPFHQPRNLKDLAKQANDQLAKTLQAKVKEGKQLGHIIIADWIEWTPFVSIVIQANKNNAALKRAGKLLTWSPVKNEYCSTASAAYVQFSKVGTSTGSGCTCPTAKLLKSGVCDIGILSFF